jgi:hypothetical protein
MIKLESLRRKLISDKNLFLKTFLHFANQHKEFLKNSRPNVRLEA